MKSLVVLTRDIDDTNDTTRNPQSLEEDSMISLEGCLKIQKASKIPQQK